MQKNAYRALERIVRPGELGIVEAGQVVELDEAEAATYDAAVERVGDKPKRARVIREGRYTQYDAEGVAREFGPGETIELSDEEVEAYGEERFEVVTGAPAPAPAPAFDDEDQPTRF